VAVRRPPPWATVTVRLPTTVPAKVTIPAPAARTGVPGGAAMSIPQCPAYRPTGANPRTTGPDTGGKRPTQDGDRVSAAATRSSAIVIWGAPPCASPSRVA